MSMKPVAYLAFIVNTVLFGTYYAVAKNALGHIDPVMFSYFEMMTLVPVGLCILLCCWRRVTRAVVRRGMMLGSSLCLALFTISIALKYTSATSTAFFPSLNGFLAAMLAWLVLRQPVTKATWIAGILSVVGTAMLILNVSMDGLRGVLIAFLGGVFFTIYVFLSDSSSELTKEKIAPLPLFGVELLTMAVWANLIVLLFGDWHTLHLVLPQDSWTVLYVAFACTFVPTFIAAFMQKHVSPVTVSFIYILEPVFGALIAYIYLHETLPMYGYIGGVLIVFGAIIHTCGMAGTVQKNVDNTTENVDNAWEKIDTTRATASTGTRATIPISTRATTRVRPYYTGYSEYAGLWNELTRRSAIIMLIGTLLYSFVVVSASLVLFAWLGGLPPKAWIVLFRTVSQSNLQNYYGMWPLTMEHEMLLAQVLCWIMAWSALVLTLCISLRHTYHLTKDVLDIKAVQSSEIAHTVRLARVEHAAPVVRVNRTASYEKHYSNERVTEDLIAEIDTLPVPTSRSMREYLQTERRTVEPGCNKLDPYTLHSKQKVILEQRA